MENDRSGKELFEKSLDTIRRVVEFVGIRHRLNLVEREDFSSYVMLRMIEDDYRRLRQFQGRSRLDTYLNVVLHRLFLDFRSQQWGKWRPSTRARALGEPAMVVERLLYRDGLDRSEILHSIGQYGVDLDADGLEDVFREIPHRPRRHYVAVEDVADTTSGVGTLSQRERTAAAKQIEIALVRTTRGLSAEDRAILKLRFIEGCTVQEVAKALNLLPRPLYRRVERLLRRLRKGLEEEGLDRAEARAVWQDMIHVDVESAFEETCSVVAGVERERRGDPCGRRTVP